MSFDSTASELDLETSAVSANSVNMSSSSGSMSVNYVEVIETVIASLDSQDSAMVSHPEGSAHLWKFTYGSVEVFVQLSGTTEDDTLSVWAAVLKLPVAREADLFRKLLQMNVVETFESRFALLNDEVVVIAMRTLADISPFEISRAVTVVATIADNNDEALQAEFR